MGHLVKPQPVSNNLVDASQRGSYPLAVSASRNFESWQQVESRQDFAAFLRGLAADCEQACSDPDPHSPAAER
ncbi:hypothetical protein GCM10010289_84300 [Streptomyces violascens]|nr:hypothetical protein GCM10010289_84300 [Streptomyces violascens]